jgi:serine/threonine protein kinase
LQTNSYPHYQLTRIEYIHNKNSIHRDIKPENFCIGTGSDSNIIYIIDFGLSKRYKNPKTGEHIPFRDKKSLTGTARYASLNTHLGIEQSRRDDLESIGYMLLYFMRGNLPWQGLLGADSKNKYKKITEKKTIVSAESLCEGYPTEFVIYIKYVKQLKFDEKPDYSYLRKLLKDAFYALNYNSEVFFDWITIQSQLKLQVEDCIHNKKKDVEPLKPVDHMNDAHNNTNAKPLLINLPKENKIQLKEDIDKKKFKSSQELGMIHNCITNKTKETMEELDDIPNEKDKAVNVPNITFIKKPKKIGSYLLLNNL